MVKQVKYVLIIGSSNMDLNIYSKRLPVAGETVTGGVFKQFLGGKGANQAVASVRSGSNTFFIGKIGMDSFGDQMISKLALEGINIDYIIRDPQEKSGVAFILIDENGENMISVAPGANVKLSIQDIQSRSELIRNASSVVVQMEIPLVTIKNVFEIASAGKVIKILNPAPLKPIPTKLLKYIDFIIPNEGELYRLHSLLGFKEVLKEGREKIILTAKDISTMGIKNIIITLGSKGCLIYNSANDEYIEISAPKVDVVDTVGAGDCFIGVFASMLIKGKEILDAAKFATVAASIAVTRRGAQESMPYLVEIEDSFEQLNFS
ncbi:MAG: ribokinase [Promethearchaeota archaeon]